MAEASVPLDCHIREPDPQLVSYALRVRNVPSAVSSDVLRELFDQGGHVEHLEAFEVPPGRLALSGAPIVTCKVRYSSVVSSLSAFVMFYHTLVLRGQPLMVDFWQPETPDEYITVPPICTKFVVDLVQKFNSHSDMLPPRGFKGWRQRHLVPVAPPPQLPDLGLTLQLTEDPVLRKLADDALAEGLPGVDPFLPALAIIPILVQANIIPPRPNAEAAWHQKWLALHPPKQPRQPKPPKQGNPRAGLYAPTNKQASAALNSALPGAFSAHPPLHTSGPTASEPPAGTPWIPQHGPPPHVMAAGLPTYPPGQFPQQQVLMGPGGVPMVLNQQLGVPMHAPPGQPFHPVPFSAPGAWPQQQPPLPSPASGYPPHSMPGPRPPEGTAPALMQTATPGAATACASVPIQPGSGGGGAAPAWAHGGGPPLSAPVGSGKQQPQQAQQAQDAPAPPLQSGLLSDGRMPSVSDALAAAASLCTALHLEDSGSAQNVAPAKPPLPQQPNGSDQTGDTGGQHTAVGLSAPGDASGAGAAGGAAGAPAADDAILGYITLENGQVMAVRRDALRPTATACAPPMDPLSKTHGDDVSAAPIASTPPLPPVSQSPAHMHGPTPEQSRPGDTFQAAQGEGGQPAETRLPDASEGYSAQAVAWSRSFQSGCFLGPAPSNGARSAGEPAQQAAAGAPDGAAAQKAATDGGQAQSLQAADGTAFPSEAATAAAVQPGPAGASAAGVCDPSVAPGAAAPAVSEAQPREAAGLDSDGVSGDRQAAVGYGSMQPLAHLPADASTVQYQHPTAGALPGWPAHGPTAGAAQEPECAAAATMHGMPLHAVDPGQHGGQAPLPPDDGAEVHACAPYAHAAGAAPLPLHAPPGHASGVAGVQHGGSQVPMHAPHAYQPYVPVSDGLVQPSLPQDEVHAARTRLVMQDAHAAGDASAG